MILASLILSIAGFAALAGAMRRHAKQIGLPVVSPGRLRLVGCALLAASFAILLGRMDWRMAMIAWIGQAGLAAAIWVATLSAKARPAASPTSDRRGGRGQPSRTDSSTSSVNAIEI
jgi:hypothetical protein